MAKKLQLSVAEPCHENWEGMTAVEKGKFCGSCQKQVIDFSTMGDREIAAFFKRPSTGSVCGRFMADQLERDIEIPKKRIPWMKYFFQLVTPTFIFTKLSAQEPLPKITVVCLDTITLTASSAQRLLGKVVPQITGSPIKQPVIDIKKRPVLDDTLMAPEGRIVKGNICNEENSSIGYASVTIKGTTKGTITNKDGNFEIAVKEKDVLIVSCVGMQSIERAIVKDDKFIVIKLEMQPKLTGEVAITIGTVAMVAPKPNPKIPVIGVLKNDNQLKLFPNPVRSGFVITIEPPKKMHGDYNLQIQDIAGTVVYTTQISIDAMDEKVNFQLPLLASGTYVLSLGNKRTKGILSNKFVVE